MRRQALFAVLAAATLIQGCQPTYQARTVSSSGFLGTDYARLHEGKEGEALLVYRNPNVHWADYKKIRLDPVTIWTGDQSAFNGFSAADRQKLADSFYSAVQQQLSKNYEMVTSTGPGVMHVQIALTDAKASSPVMDTISTVMPVGLAVSEATSIVTGKPSFVGEAQAEAKITDAQTGALLAAAIDRRVGGKSIGGSTNSWDDVQKAFQYWAEQIRYRLCKERGDTACE